MSAAPLQADAAEIGTYYDVLYRYADQGTYIAIRAFDQRDAGRPAVLVKGIKINGGGAGALVRHITDLATRVANRSEPAVFAPPVCTFTRPDKATLEDIANGVALSVDLDTACPAAGREHLEGILGPATLVVASGGEWVDPDTGAIRDKAHLHWRLTEPTRSPEDHAKLREARRLAALLIGGDLTAAPLVHPLRMPGSWNLKTRPGRLARNIAVNDAAEIDLDDALERLGEVVEAAGVAFRDWSGPRVSAEPQAALANVVSALKAIPNRDVEWEEWNLVGMAAWRATGGSQDGLEAWAAWSAKSGKHDADNCIKRWQHFERSPPSKVGAGTIFYMAKTTGWQFPSSAAVKPAAPRPDVPDGMPSHSRPANDEGAEPRPIPEPATTNVVPLVEQRTDKREAPKGDTTPPDPGMADLSQDGVAWNFAAEMDGRLAFDHTAREWFAWEDSRWTKDARASAFHRARLYCHALRDTADEPPKDIGKISFVDSVERAARSDPRLATAHADWDQNRWLLGVPGGVVDLRTGETHAPDPALRIRRQTSVAPAEASSPAPLWFKFLDEAFLRDTTDEERKDDPAMPKRVVDRETIAYLQRFTGYLLTGDVSEEMLAFFYGSGGNGKGVFIGAITSILADYAVSVPMQVFVADSRLNLEYYRARMAGARLVVASEPDAGAVWSESLIKELTGNEAPIPARDPYGKPFEFDAHFKICLVGNHAPRLKGRTKAMERRLRVVPFNNEPEKVNDDLKEQLKAEYPAILRWMLDGCATWQHDGLGTSPAIRAATEAYFSQQDSLKRWMTERCDLIETARQKARDLFADFTAWLRDNGDPAITSADFREMMTRTKGLTYVAPKNVQYVKGICLKPPAETPYGRPRDGTKDTPEMPAEGGKGWGSDYPF